MLQRAFDIACAGAGLVLASPLLLVIAGLILVDDGGPVLFTQTRVGADRTPFRIYKFRTMRDGKTTRVGRWLRATGLDELPQLVNMLLGDMSLIGPRPLTFEDVARLGWDDGRHDVRFSVRPGVIGLAQLYEGLGQRLLWFLYVTCVRVPFASLVLRFVYELTQNTMPAVRRVRLTWSVRGWLRARRRRAIARDTAPRAATHRELAWPATSR